MCCWGMRCVKKEKKKGWTAWYGQRNFFFCSSCYTQSQKVKREMYILNKYIVYELWKYLFKIFTFVSIADILLLWTHPQYNLCLIFVLAYFLKQNRISLILYYLFFLRLLAQKSLFFSNSLFIYFFKFICGKEMSKQFGWFFFFF